MTGTRQQLASGIIVPVYAESPYMRDHYPRLWATNPHGELQIVDPWRDLRYYGVPTFEERRLRCEEMGLFICTCTGVAECAPKGLRGLICDPACKVHRIVFELPL